MAGGPNGKEGELIPNPFMTEWLTAFVVLTHQSPIFKLKEASYPKRQATVIIKGHEIEVSFAPDNTTVTWESKTPGFTLFSVCEWDYSEKLFSKHNESIEVLVSPVCTVGDQQFTISFERFLSTDKHVVKKSNIVTAPKK